MHPYTSNSTGPKTPEGKANSAQNAFLHGCCSSTVRLTENEQLSDYTMLEQSWLEAYKIDQFNVANALETDLVRKCIDADWLSRRAERAYADLEADLLNLTPKLIDWTEQHYFKPLALANRYRVANRNTLTKAVKALEDYRKARAAEQLKEQKLTHNEEKQVLLKQKNAPEQTFEEAYAEARALSIRLGYLNPDGTPTGKKD